MMHFLLQQSDGAADGDAHSDNPYSDPLNWLGMQLMLVRDELSGDKAWTKYIKSLVDVESGRPWSPFQARQWQDIVQNASSEMEVQLGRVSR